MVSERSQMASERYPIVSKEVSGRISEVPDGSKRSQMVSERCLMVQRGVSEVSDGV